MVAAQENSVKREWAEDTNQAKTKMVPLQLTLMKKELFFGAVEEHGRLRQA